MGLLGPRLVALSLKPEACTIARCRAEALARRRPESPHAVEGQLPGPDGLDPEIRQLEVRQNGFVPREIDLGWTVGSDLADHLLEAQSDELVGRQQHETC